MNLSHDRGSATRSAKRSKDTASTKVRSCECSCSVCQDTEGMSAEFARYGVLRNAVAKRSQMRASRSDLHVLQELKNEVFLTLTSWKL